MTQLKPYDEYKESGIEWVGRIPAGWETRPLFAVALENTASNRSGSESNLLSLSYGRIVRKDIADNDGLLPASFDTYQVIGRDDIVLRLTDLQNDKRSLRSAISPERGIITSAYLALHPTTVRPRFLSYLLRAYDLQKVFYSMGGGLRQSMKFSDMKRLPVILPPDSTQQEVITYLDRETAQIDDLIGKQVQLIELLEEKRQAIITHAVTKGLDPDVPTKPSRIPWLNGAPDHWTKVKLSWAFKFLNGDRGSNYPSRDEFQSEGVPFINAGHLSGGRVDMSTMNYISREKYEELGGAKLREGDVLYCLRGSLGKHALLTGLREGALASSLVALRALRTSWVSPAYLTLLLKSPAAETQLAIIASGSAQPNMSVENLQSFSFPIPPLEEQQLILDYVDRKCKRLDAIQVTARAMILRLQERRSALISAAVTGGIDTREGAA